MRQNSYTTPKSHGDSGEFSLPLPPLDISHCDSTEMATIADTDVIGESRGAASPSQKALADKIFDSESAKGSCSVRRQGIVSATAGKDGIFPSCSSSSDAGQVLAICQSTDIMLLCIQSHFCFR